MSSGGFRRVGSVGVAAALVFGLVGAVPRPPAGAAVVVCDPAVPETCTLRQLADELGIRIGASAEADEVEPGPYADTLGREFNSLTPENALKWYSTNPAPGVFDFEDGDAVVGFATANAMEVRAHTLVWTQDTYTPDWVKAVNDPDELAQWVAQHVVTVAGRYAGQVQRWDVINEPLATAGTTLSDSVFHRVLPPGWMASVFSAVRAVDPDAELWINEYGTDWVPGKHEAFVALVRDLLAAGAPIDGVGLQVHRPSVDGPDVAAFSQQLRDFTDLGLEVAITELDIPIPPGGDTALLDQAQAYRRVVESCLSVPGCTEITVWGVTDANTWLDGLGVFPTPTRPLLFDNGFGAKPAYDEVRAVLAEAVLARRAGPPVDAPTGPVTAAPAFTG